MPSPIIKICFAILLFASIMACKNNNTENLSPKNGILVNDSVQQMMASIAKDITHDGPVAWLHYFEQSPNFYMASAGQLAFANYDSANNFIKNILVKNINKIELQWNDIRIDSLTQKLADVAAGFHENITDFAGKQTLYTGYFTATVEQTNKGWQLRNAHWSTAK